MMESWPNSKLSKSSQKSSRNPEYNVCILKAKARHEPVEDSKSYSPPVTTRDEIRRVYDAQDECIALRNAKWRRCLVAMEERKKKLERRRAAKRKRKEVSNQGAAAAEPQPVDWYDSSDSDK